jgi:multidrug resistance protein
MALTIFIDFTGFGIIIPLLPFWARHLGANAFGVGLVLTAYALAQFLFTPVLGSLSDRYGRRPIILISLGVEASGFALTALAGSLPALLAARFIAGLGASNLGSAQAVVADVTPPDGRARGMGMLGAAIGLGFVIGPAIGGALALRGLAAPFWAAMVVALLNALLVARFLPETSPRLPKSRAKQSRPAKSSAVSARGVGALLGGWRQLDTNVVIARLIAVNLLFSTAFSAMEAVFPLLTLRRFGWGAVQVGYLFTYVGLVVVVMQGGLVGRLVKRYGERRLLLSGLALLAVGLALLPVAFSLAIVLGALGLLAVGEGAVTPTVTALLSLASSTEHQGETLGLAQGVAGLGRILGPLLGGALFVATAPTAPFLAASALVVMALVLTMPTVVAAVRAAPVAPPVRRVAPRRSPAASARPRTFASSRASGSRTAAQRRAQGRVSTPAR